MFCSFNTYVVHFLQPTTDDSASEYVPSGHSSHTVSSEWLPERQSCRPQWIQHSVYRKSINLYKCCKRRVVPGSWTPEPCLQRLCGTQVKQFFGSEQWNPSLHMQMLRFLGSCSGVSKLLSERRLDTSCVKHTSISTGMFLLNVSQSLTFVAVRLTFTLGFLRVSILIFILIACLALRLLTSAEGRHAGPWKTRARR